MKGIFTCPFKQMRTAATCINLYKQVEFFFVNVPDVTGSSVGASLYELPQISQPVVLEGRYLD